MMGDFVIRLVSVRHRGEFLEVPGEEIDYMDVSPKQVVSIAAGMIPFLEHDDANRALMGANMMRQAVPLLRVERPYVATGLEGRAARDSRVMVLAEKAGVVAYVSARKIVVSADGSMPTKKTPTEDYQEYRLQKFRRSNAGTCINQKPIVRIGAEGGCRPAIGGWSRHGSRRTGTGQESAGCVHAMVWLQLRGCYSDQPAPGS
jgi:DNA-directed RNA polymerase subunit beta